MGVQALGVAGTALRGFKHPPPKTFGPENRLSLPNPQLLKADRQRYEDRLLSVYEPASNRFYLFEDLL